VWFSGAAAMTVCAIFVFLGSPDSLRAGSYALTAAARSVAGNPGLGGSISILLPTAILLKVLSNFCRNLTISHLVNCFNTDDASTEIVSFKTFFQFAL
jgi:hypothetical protein